MTRRLEPSMIHRATFSSPRTATIIAAALLIVLPSLFRLVWQINTPLNLLPNATHDDGLFMRLAHQIAMGQWLGPFNQFTLMKGPGYPVFLAVGATGGLSVSAAHAVFGLDRTARDRLGGATHHRLRRMRRVGVPDFHFSPGRF